MQQQNNLKADFRQAAQSLVDANRELLRLALNNPKLQSLGYLASVTDDLVTLAERIDDCLSRSAS